MKFFEITFLIANISLEVVFEKLFLTLNGANIDFLDQKLWSRTYITQKALPITRLVELMGKKSL